jgi:SanA protein
MFLFRIIFKIGKWFTYLIFAIFAFGIYCYFWIQGSTKKQCFSRLEDIPKTKVGLVLGTSRYLRNGNENLYFSYRIKAAEQLFKAGKVKYLLLSGDNRKNEYNEPKDMQQALLELGIPDSCLVLDYAGLRTFDSMVRAKEVFGQDSLIVISQSFHTARATFIANRIGLYTIGFNAEKVTSQQAIKIKIREFFSRIKCVLDIYVLNTKPKHLGEKIVIGG